jgi:hypothetical protein
MQESSNKCAGKTCKREVKNMHCERRKTYCRSKKKHIFRGHVQLFHG